MTPLHSTEYILFTDDLEIIFIRNFNFIHVIMLFCCKFYQNLIWERWREVEARTPGRVIMMVLGIISCN